MSLHFPLLPTTHLQFREIHLDIRPQLVLLHLNSFLLFGQHPAYKGQMELGAEGLSRDDPILNILSWWHNSGIFLHTGRVWRTVQDLARVLMRDIELQRGYLVYGKIQPRELGMMSDGNME